MIHGKAVCRDGRGWSGVANGWEIPSEDRKTFPKKRFGINPAIHT